MDERFLVTFYNGRTRLGSVAVKSTTFDGALRIAIWRANEGEIFRGQGYPAFTSVRITVAK